MVAHHLVVDAVSWRILLEDLYTAYLQYEHNQAIHHPAETTPYLIWAKRLANYTSPAPQSQEVDYWLLTSEANNSGLPVYPVSTIQLDKDLNTEDTAQHIPLTLGQEEIQELLRKVQPVYWVEAPVILLTALVRILHRWIDVTSLRIDLEGHGWKQLFDDFDLTRTIGGWG